MPIAVEPNEIGPNLKETLKFIRQYESTKCLCSKYIHSATTLALIRSIVHCNWELPLGKFVDLEQVRKRLPAHLQKTKFLEFCLDILEVEGYLKRSDGEWKVIGLLPSVAESMAKIEGLMNKAIQICGRGEATVCLANRIIDNISDVLDGNLSVLALMFPAN